MDFAFDARTEELRRELLDFMDSHVYPAEHHFEVEDPAAPFSWERPPVMDELKTEARRRGLWNLFLPHSEAGLASATFSTHRWPRSADAAPTSHPRR